MASVPRMSPEAYRQQVASRRGEFGLGATFKEKDPAGNETTRNAIEAVGGDVDHNYETPAQYSAYERHASRTEAYDW